MVEDVDDELNEAMQEFEDDDEDINEADEIIDGNRSE